MSAHILQPVVYQKLALKWLHKTTILCRRLKSVKREFFSTHLLRDGWIFCNFALAFWDASASVEPTPGPSQKGRESERSAKLAFEMQNNQENALQNTSY